MCSEHPPTQPRKVEPWEGEGSLVSTNSFYTDQCVLAEQKLLFIHSSGGRAPAHDPTGLEKKPWLMIKDCFPFCALSPWHHTAWAVVAVSNNFKAGLCFYFWGSIATLQSLVAVAYGMNRPPQAAWGFKQTIPSSRGNMINKSIWFTWKRFSMDKAALTLLPSWWWAQLPCTVWRAPVLYSVLPWQGVNLLWSTLFPWANRTFNWLYYTHFIPCWSYKLITTLIGLLILKCLDIFLGICYEEIQVMSLNTVGNTSFPWASEIASQHCWTYISLIFYVRYFFSQCGMITLPLPPCSLRLLTLGRRVYILQWSCKMVALLCFCSVVLLW